MDKLKKKNTVWRKTNGETFVKLQNAVGENTYRETYRKKKLEKL